MVLGLPLNIRTVIHIPSDLIGQNSLCIGALAFDGAVAAEANPDRHDTVCSSSALSNLLARYPARKQARLVATSPSASVGLP